MARSEPPTPGGARPAELTLPPGAGLPTGPGATTAPPGLVESWDPTDDEQTTETRHQVQWNWHGRQSWGRRLVAAFPLMAAVLALGLIVYATASAQGAIDQVRSVAGTGGATLLTAAPRLAPGGATGIGQLTDYQDVTFAEPSGTSRALQGSTSLAFPPYVGWEVNGSAGAANGVAVARGGRLHVGVRRATPDFRGWFVTATGTTPASCAFQFSAASPPAVTAPSPQAIGELVMAVQTGSTVTTGDINYVVVAENVASDGHRNLIAGYSQGHLSHATEHILKRVPWAPGPIRVAIQTNGNNQLSVWVNGGLFYQADDLALGIAPPLQPYLEVQARQTPFAVAYDGYSSVCQRDVVVSGLPDGSSASLGGRSAPARNGSAVFPDAITAPPVTDTLTVHLPGNSRPVRFARHTYWPGAHYSFVPGT